VGHLQVDLKLEKRWQRNRYCNRITGETFAKEVKNRESKVIDVRKGYVA
jgi:hypothetical protein